MIGGLVGIPAAALSAAADADVQGLKATGTNARYYYQLEPNQLTKETSIILPGCYVVAYSYPLSKPSSHWCENEQFKKGVADTCAAGHSALSALRLREDNSGGSGLGIESLSVPEIYMEIGYEKSSYPDVVLPQIVAMYYPKSVIEPNSKEPRAISIQLDFTSPQQNDPLKAAQVAILVPSIKPAPVVDSFSLGNAITGWTTVPSKIPGGILTTPEKKQAFMPVTVKASLNEVGNPHAFLQAFAKAFAGSSGDYTKMLASEITPLGQATARQTQDKNTADYTAALGAAQKSRADLLTACAANPSSQQAKASALSLFTTTVANQRKANLAADIAGVTKPFDSPDTVSGILPSCWQ